MISNDKITEIFCSIDDFCLVFEPVWIKRQLSTGKKTRKRKFTMSNSEIITITVLFHLSDVRTFKHCIRPSNPYGRLTQPAYTFPSY